MGVIVTKDEDNSKLQQKINADLRARIQSSSDSADLVDDSEYLSETKRTSRFGWLWIVLIVLAIASLILIIFV